MATTMEVGAPDGLSLGRVSDRALSTIRHNPIVTLLLALISGAAPIMLAAYASSRILDAQQNASIPQALAAFAVTLLLGTAVGTIPQAFLTRPVIAESQGRRTSLRESIQTGASVLLPILLVGIVYAVAVVTGLALLIVPGVMLMLAWAIPAAILVEERAGVLQSFRRSQQLTRGARWKIFGLLLLFYAVSICKEVAVELLSSEWDSTTLAASYSNPVYLGLTAVAETLLAALWCCVLAALYVELRQWKDGPASQQLEQIFA